MAEKDGTKILAIITICIMLVTVGFSGCVEEDGGDDNLKNEEQVIRVYLKNNTNENDIKYLEDKYGIKSTYNGTDKDGTILFFEFRIISNKINDLILSLENEKIVESVVNVTKSD